MKDWYVLLSDLTEEQENNLVELCKKACDDYDGITDDEDCIKYRKGFFIDYGWSSDGECEKITYKKAVKRLNKMIEEKGK